MVKDAMFKETSNKHKSNEEEKKEHRHNLL